MATNEETNAQRSSTLMSQRFDGGSRICEEGSITADTLAGTSTMLPPFDILTLSCDDLSIFSETTELDFPLLDDSIQDLSVSRQDKWDNIQTSQSQLSNESSTVEIQQVGLPEAGVSLGFGTDSLEKTRAITEIPAISEERRSEENVEFGFNKRNDSDTADQHYQYYESKTVKEAEDMTKFEDGQNQTEAVMEHRFLETLNWTDFQKEDMALPDDSSFNEDVNNLLPVDTVETEQILNSLSPASTKQTSTCAGAEELLTAANFKRGSKRKMSHCETETSSENKSRSIKKKRLFIPPQPVNQGVRNQNMCSKQLGQRSMTDSRSSGNYNTLASYISRTYDVEANMHTKCNNSIIMTGRINSTAIATATATTTQALSPSFSTIPAVSPTFPSSSPTPTSISPPILETIKTSFTSVSLPVSAETQITPTKLVPGCFPLSKLTSESLPKLMFPSNHGNNGSEAIPKTSNPVLCTTHAQLGRRDRKRTVNRTSLPRKNGIQHVFPNVQHLTPSTPSCTPSRFCHICTRSTRPTDIVVCGNVKRGTCRKIICHRCFNGLPSNSQSSRHAGCWECTHCQKVSRFEFCYQLIHRPFHTHIHLSITDSFFNDWYRLVLLGHNVSHIEE